jgi:hypothetical protein
MERLQIVAYILITGMILSMVWGLFVGSKFFRQIKQKRGKINIQQDKGTILQLILSLILVGVFSSILVGLPAVSIPQDEVLGNSFGLGKYQFLLIQILLCNCGWWLIAGFGIGGRVLLNTLMYKNKQSK